jgi:hypothetical protein
LRKAIEQCNERELENKPITIERYIRDVKKESRFNNLYVKRFSEDFAEG